MANMDISEDSWRSAEKTKENFFTLMERQKKKLDPSEVTDFYNKWGAEYDAHFEEYYGAPAYCANALLRHLEGKTDITILDVGAGTGAAGEALHNKGFTNIDAIEPAFEMMEKARKKGFYMKMYQKYFSGDVGYIETDVYDVIVCTGAVGFAHMGAACFPEMVRIVKPGGLVVVTMPEKEEMDDGTVDHMIKQLEKDGKWKCLERQSLSNFYFHDEEGKALVLKVN